MKRSVRLLAFGAFLALVSPAFAENNFRFNGSSGTALRESFLTFARSASTVERTLFMRSMVKLIAYKVNGEQLATASDWFAVCAPLTDGKSLEELASEAKELPALPPGTARMFGLDPWE
jgi:hypothetical protein